VWLEKASADLNSALATAANTVNVESNTKSILFKDPTAYFDDHEMCDEASYLNAIVLTLTPGDDNIRGPFAILQGVVSAQSAHPNRTGQQAYATALTDALR